MSFFDNHTHTHYSNLRLLDSINDPKSLIKTAINLGLEGIAITDHECLSGHIKFNQIAQEIKKEHPDFKIALGNEIYLVDDRINGQKYYHFILIAKDEFGHQGLKELSSKAWLNSYTDRGMERVPLLKTELQEIMKKYPGHIIGTTACLGGELGTLISDMQKCEAVNDMNNAQIYHNQIIDFILMCKEIFNEDFYLECAPAASKDQILVNQRLLKISEAFNLKMCIGSDAHYLTKDDRYVHKAYLNSKNGEREIDSFYEYTYLMSAEEARENLRASFSDDIIDWLFSCSLDMKNSIQDYSLFQYQAITEVPVKDYPRTAWWGVNNDYADEMNNYPTLKSMFTSDNQQERYWINQCWESLEKKTGKTWIDNLEYINRLEEEAKTKRVIGEKLHTNMFAYPNTLQHYIDLFWECGSIVGAGRGSSCSGLNHYLLGITQLDPIKWNLPWFRYMNEERVELGSLWLILPSCK